MDLVEVADIPRATYYWRDKRLSKAVKYENVKEAIIEIFHEHKVLMDTVEFLWLIKVRTPLSTGT